MMIRNGYVLLAAATLALASGVASCGNDDPATGDGIDYTEKVVTGYRMQYNMKLADPSKARRWPTFVTPSTPKARRLKTLWTARSGRRRW